MNGSRMRDMKRVMNELNETGQNKVPIKGSVHITVMTAEIGTVPLQLYDALKIFLVYHIFSFSHFISSFVTCMLFQ